jgi:hypothetical protein
VNGTRIRGAAAVAATAAVAAGLAGVSGASASSGKGSKAAAPASSGPWNQLTTNLKGVCPNPVVVQTNWWPEPDHGGTYELIGPGGKIDPSNNSYTGPLGKTGVNLQILAGGPATGYQQVSSQLYQNQNILLGYVGTDEAIQNSQKAPTTALFATYDKNPQIFLWGNPKWNFTSVKQIGQANAPVLAFNGATYLSLFEQEGLLKASQVNTSYNGSPAQFVADNGDVVEQGFATQEPYEYAHEVKEWDKPVKFMLVNEYPVYQSALSIRTSRLKAEAPCLSKLIPLFQQAEKDYIQNPAPVNNELIKIDNTYKTSGFSLTPGGNAAAVHEMRSLHLVANGPNNTLGAFSSGRVQKLITQLSPVFKGLNDKLKPGLKPADLATNQFLSKKIGLQ